MGTLSPFAFDKVYYDKGLNSVAGIDEAGRGPLAGPVTAAAVILPQNIKIPNLNDSKQLTEKKRNVLFEIIKENALAYSISIVDSIIIDKINILQATFLAMKQSVLDLKIKPDLCLIDGNYQIPNFRSFSQQFVVGGDGKSASIAAASILAKVTRDKIMKEYAVEFPEYGFEKHKGYGTKIHMEALKKYGACPIHRMSFAPVRLCSQEQQWLLQKI